MSIVKDALMEEIIERKKLSVEMYDELNKSKTNIKKKIFGKKLKKNNTILADLLIKLDTLTKKTYNNTE